MDRKHIIILKIVYDIIVNETYLNPKITKGFKSQLIEKLLKLTDLTKDEIDEFRIRLLEGRFTRNYSKQIKREFELDENQIEIQKYQNLFKNAGYKLFYKPRISEMNEEEFNNFINFINSGEVRFNNEINTAKVIISLLLLKYQYCYNYDELLKISKLDFYKFIVQNFSLYEKYELYFKLIITKSDKSIFNLQKRSLIVYISQAWNAYLWYKRKKDLTLPLN